MLQEDNRAAMTESGSEQSWSFLECSWEFCLIDFSVMAEYLPDFKSVDDFDGCPYLFEPEH